MARRATRLQLVVPQIIEQIPRLSSIYSKNRTNRTAPKATLLQKDENRLQQKQEHEA